MILEKIVAALDPECYACIQGAIPQTTALLDQKWDKIFYTGSINVAKIIAKKAAETLTPVTLELGGKNPAIITKHADMRLAARRLLWGKFLNAGQVCISQNYTLIDKEVLPAFLREMEVAMKEFYPDGARASPDYGRIVNNRQWKRLKEMIDNTKGKILIGGTMDETDRFLEPTVIQGQSYPGIEMSLDAKEANIPFLQLTTSPTASSLTRALGPSCLSSQSTTSTKPFALPTKSRRPRLAHTPLAPKLRQTKYCKISAPEEPQSTMLSSTAASLTSRSVASVIPVKAPTEARRRSTASHIDGVSQLPQVGWRV
jgi:hypothetical protein